MMKAEVKRKTEKEEYWFREGCFITEIANDESDSVVSIARARVKPGFTTAWHMLDGVVERYIIASGNGRVEVGERAPEVVEAGDVVRIPENTRQRITNSGDDDLIFYAVCSPPFRSGCYVALEEKGK
ncbi:cupin domain-containing protein [Desulfopila inferna]|uniref:cupin domain-containing protein n=1 Tax=Desulfopila inferna TaxID=468528 RepID=UPI001965807B|nr:cupin domain-containing protein [Desulfopila inferna]MBM9603847.1 cupin domain-containing protein [Desulfopila inferna]